MRYHRNATTNIKQRTFISTSLSSNSVLAEQLCISSKTVRKWRHRNEPSDRTSRPASIGYTLDTYTERLIRHCRQHNLMLDSIWQELQPHIPEINRTNTYRTLLRANLNRLPKQLPDKQPFKVYEPGFLHLDWFYLPRLEPRRRYCIVAIDRATRWLVVGFYDSMSKPNALEFVERLVNELAFSITTILTDNGGCFTNRWYTTSRGGARGTSDFSDYCASWGIKHRMTKFRHPWTNGLAENTNKQIKTNTTKRYCYQDYQQAENGITAYTYYHNYKKRHRALGWKTTYETTLDWYRKDPTIFVKNPTLLKGTT
jgi:transposase InsO family protein